MAAIMRRASQKDWHDTTPGWLTWLHRLDGGASGNPTPRDPPRRSQERRTVPVADQSTTVSHSRPSPLQTARGISAGCTIGDAGTVNEINGHLFDDDERIVEVVAPLSRQLPPAHQPRMREPRPTHARRFQGDPELKRDVDL